MRPLPIFCGRLRSGTLSSAQPLALCLLTGDLAHTALDRGGWRCVGVPGLWISCLCLRYVSGQALPRAIPCFFLGFVLDALGWQFYHPTSRHVFPSQDVTFDESVPFYRLFPYRSAPPPPPPLFLAPGPPPVDPLPPQGPAPSGVSQEGPFLGPAPVPVAVDSVAARGAASGGAEARGAEARGAESEGAETGGAEPEGVETGGAEPGGVATGGGEPGGVEPEDCLRSSCMSGLFGIRAFQVELLELEVLALLELEGTGAAGFGGVQGAGDGDLTVSGIPGAGGAGARGAGVGGPGAGGARVGGRSVGGAGAVAPGGTVLQQVLGTLPSAAFTTPLLYPLLDQSQSPLQLVSPLPAPSPYSEQSGSLTERREPASRPVSPVCTARHVPRSRPPPVPGTHAMTLRSSSVPLRSDRARAASPTVSRLLASAVTDPSFESAAASALIAELLDFAAACRLDYASALVAESASASPQSFEGECALGMDVLEDRQEDFESLAAAVPRFASMLLAPEGDPNAPDILTPRSYAEAITSPYSSQWQAAIDAEMASWMSTGTYIDEVPPPGANIVRGMWIFRVKRPPGSPPAFKHSLDFSTPFLQGSLHEEILLRRPPGFTESFPAGTQWSLLRLVYGLRQAPREWHDTLRTTLAALGFPPATADPSPFYVLVYVDDLVFAIADTEALTLVKSEVLQRFGFQFSSPLLTPVSTCHSLSAPPSNESVEPSGPYPELVGCLMYLMTCTRPDLAYPLSLLARYVAPGTHRKVHWDAAKRVLRYLCSTSGMGLLLGGRGPVDLTGHADASWVDESATQRLSQGYTFSLGSGSVSWRSIRSSSVLSSSCEAEIYAGAMAAQELRWLTYLLTDLGEQPRSPPVLYVDNKAMIAVCREHKLEHRTKHIALRYFLARELQQRGQLRLVYVSTRANTADVFTKALPPSDHQRFFTMLGLVPTLPHFLTA
ncbi:unnamed protein product [Closterium sp. NIES-54]